ncbi:MAG TPA: amidase [Opitutaceae bacterium]|nr:amidase [Opitutaceae bacterium]
MDTFADKRRAGSSFAYWQSLSPAAASRELHRRVDALPDRLRRAAVAWVRPQAELEGALAAGGSRAPLRGVPFAVKDLFDLAGVPTYAGSTFLPDVRPTPARTARLVERLVELGAAPAAKSHLVEFASGLTGENPHYGDCPHPHFPDRLTGGSSSGSAALVAAGVMPLALGTDTGGSVRVPASWCGAYGFRLAPGDEFIRDAFPLAPTLDSAGWFAADAADMLATWRAVTGGGGPARPPRGCFLSLDELLEDADPEVAHACSAAAQRLGPAADESAKAALLDSWRDAVDAYLGIGMTEAFAVHRAWLGPFKDRYDPVIWQRFIEAGTWPPQRIVRSRAAREHVRLVFHHFFQDYDFLVLPAVPSPAPRKAEATPELRRRVLALTAPASLAGLPVLTLPVPLPSGLTAGLQVIAKVPSSPAFSALLGEAG